MSRETPEAEYVFYGLESGVSSCSFVSASRLMVGLTDGRCLLYALKTKKCIGHVIDTKSDGHAVVSCGELSFGILWIHSRNQSVSVFESEQKSEENAKNAEWKRDWTSDTGHYGFCAADVNQHDVFAIPHEQQSKPLVKMVANDGTTTKTVSVNDARGALMRLKWAQDWKLLVGFENGSLLLLDMSTGQELSSLEPYTQPIFGLDVDSSGKIAVVGGPVSPIKECLLDDGSKLHHTRHMHFPATSRGCAVVAISKH